MKYEQSNNFVELKWEFYYCQFTYTAPVGRICFSSDLNCENFGDADEEK